MTITIPNPPDRPGDGYLEHSLEMDLQRRITAEFISTQPVMVTLTPRLKVKTATGGYAWAKQEDRPVQRMRLVESSGVPAELRSSDGQMRQLEFMLLGEWDAVIGQYDIFEFEPGQWWEVADLYHFNGWERRASVIRYG